MSVTNLSLIRDALRALNVIDETQDPSAEQGVLCLGDLNQMLFGWAADGIDLQFFKQTSPLDNCPIPDWAEAGVKYKLALRIPHHYGATVPISVVAAADEGYATILRKSIEVPRASMDHLPMGSRYGNGDIINGN